MSVCRNGHASGTDDFCDECGVPMRPGGAGGGSAGPVPSAPGSWGSSSVSSSGAGPSSATAGPDEACPRCGTARSGRFCEEDGHDFVLAAAAGPPSPGAGPSRAPAPPSVPSANPGPPPGYRAPAGWVLRVEADRRYYETVVDREGPDIAGVSFPTYYPRAVVPLAGDEVRIGRRRLSGSTPPPEVDLTGPPLDPGVSHLHAVLLAGPAGWAVLDPGSTNGTTLNYRDEPIAVDTAVPVGAGDRIHVGAYTTLVLEQAEP